MTTMRDVALLRAVPSGSPFWLMLNGVWRHLEGVAPGVSVSKERPGSEMLTVDGVRWAQKAAAGPREWELSLERATAAAVALLEVAADSDEAVYLLDETASRSNMLSNRDCFGRGSSPVVDCGGIPLRALDLSADHVTTALVRAGVTYYARAWGGTEGSTTLSVSGVASMTATASVGWPETWPADWPTLTVMAGSFTPATDGQVTITVSGTGDVSGLMLSEALLAPRFLAGQQVPCQVSVTDPARTTSFAWPDRLSVSDYSVTLKEVG